MIHVVHISKVLTSLQAKVKVTEATQRLFCLGQLDALLEKFEIILLFFKWHFEEILFKCICLLKRLNI